ncbi:hypothetical protein [Enterococcus sp.]|uniref:hypothetical protein n=1 Tax=Enterococcus sp. TaxID=35783 RepID=UPI00289E83A3|nr:hypothetical protein [Enterococcus sp.]
MAEYLKQQITEIISINSEFPEKSLRSVWSSYDKNVHKIVVPVTTQSGITFEMSEITNVEVYLSFSKGSYGPFEGKVEDAAQKTVSFAVPEEVRGQTGNVTISIMLKLTNDRQIDLVQFKAVARLSKIDQDTPAIQEFYVPLFEDLVAETQAIAQTEQAKIQAELPAVQAQLDQALTELNQLKSGMRWYNAYKMADGRFAKNYPNKNDYTGNSEEPNLLSVGSSTITKTSNVAVAEWGARNAVQYKISGGANTNAGRFITGLSADAGLTYDFDISIYIKNIGTNDLGVNTNTNDTVIVKPGESKWLTWSRIGYTPASTTMRQFIVTRNNVADELNFIVWRAKHAIGKQVSIWTPNPAEATSVLDYQPKEKGTGFLDSTNETDYSWDYTKEFVDYALGLKADKTELNALADRVSILE